ncbi:hypothetical protein MBLNU457_7302t2 [Dothideomycetes sp. NU457]
MANNAVSASARGASFLILLQISSRALTFGLNQILLRYLSPTLLGTAVQLELYCISVLYFSRESLRVALQRRAEGLQAVVNLAYLAVAAGFVVSVFLGAALSPYFEALGDVKFLRQAVWCFGAAAVVELCAEPGFVAAQQLLRYRVRASAEASATVAKTVVTVAVVVSASRRGVDVGVLPFALGQLAYAGTLLVVYVGYMAGGVGEDGSSLLPRRIQSKGKEYLLDLFYKPLLTLSLSLTVQSSIKYVLTQGDSLLIATLASLADQGAYALSSNYGGLIARMLFQPIEEASRNLFAKLCTTPETTSKQSDGKTTKDEKPQPPAQGVKDASSTMQTILHFYGLISLLAFSLGPTIAPLLLSLVAGKTWTSTGAGDVLGAYTYYIPLLAINGVTEAFVAAVATNKELYAQSVWMGFFFAGFAGSAYLFVRVLEMGAKGLVWANCVNMALRIVFNISFVRRFFGRNTVEFDLVRALPGAGSVAVAAVVPFFTGAAKSFGKELGYGVVGELAALGSVGVVLVAAM